MPSTSASRSRSALSLTMLPAVLAAASCSPSADTQRPPPAPAAALARTISIIRSATPDRPRVLKILFYGQSISTRRWTDQAMAMLQAAYPNVRFDYRNLALGGWSAITLDRAATRDLAESYPDLVVFHVYGDHHAYERIIRTIRSTTAAEVVVQTDHVNGAIEPPCDIGLHLRWSPPPGCQGHFWFHQDLWDNYMSGRVLPRLAATYGLALDPRRQRWDAYLRRHHLPFTALIADSPHPNKVGWTLMARLFATWFEQVVATAPTPPPPTGLVRRMVAPLPGHTATYRFDGNRFELLAAGPLDGRIVAQVDGKPPQALDGCWQNSRLSRLPNAPDWPALKQVTVDPRVHQIDRWQIRVTDLNPDQTRFTFAVADRTGDEGTGRADATFTSKDGRLTIDPHDWMIAEARRANGRGLADGTMVTFDRHFVCGDEAPVALGGGRVEQRHVVATGLANGRHVVTLMLAGNAPAVAEARAYRPPLAD